MSSWVPTGMAPWDGTVVACQRGIRRMSALAVGLVADGRTEEAATIQARFWCIWAFRLALARHEILEVMGVDQVATPARCAVLDVSAYPVVGDEYTRMRSRLTHLCALAERGIAVRY